jgi:hypothetical protein
MTVERNRDGPGPYGGAAARIVSGDAQHTTAVLGCQIENQTRACSISKPSPFREISTILSVLCRCGFGLANKPRHVPAVFHVVSGDGLTLGTARNRNNIRPCLTVDAPGPGHET